MTVWCTSSPTCSFEYHARDTTSAITYHQLFTERFLLIRPHSGVHWPLCFFRVRQAVTSFMLAMYFVAAYTHLTASSVPKSVLCIELFCLSVVSLRSIVSSEQDQKMLCRLLMTGRLTILLFSRCDSIVPPSQGTEVCCALLSTEPHWPAP
jgi:hypothetical protein